MINQISKIKSDMYRLKQNVENENRIRTEIKDQILTRLATAYTALDHVQDWIKAQI